VSVRHATVATVEEQAELKMLRDQADETAAEAARTLAELATRLADAAHPGAMARRLAAVGRGAAVSALREVPGKIGGQRGARRTALAAIPVLAVAAAALLAYRRFAGESQG
jgi:hypothetical protein